MAKIYPQCLRSRATTTRTPSEKRFLDKITEKLSDEWTVFANIEYTVSGDCSRVSGEIDFLLYHEIFGIVIAEVKGGELSADADGKWRQSSHPCKNDPWEQVQRQKKFLLGHFRHAYGAARPPFAVAALPCFPDCAWREEFPPETRGNALWADDIDGDPEAFLVNFLRNSRERDCARHADFFDSALVRCALQSLFETVEKLRDHSKEERAILLKLTQEQGAALNTEARGQRRFRVCGSVGTGKTLIATEKAKRLAAEGKRVLLLGYNILLSEYLKNSVREFPNVVSGAFNEIACRALGVDSRAADALPSGERENFFEALPRKFSDFLRENPRNFDAVIVDEAQDFSEEMWLAVERMTRANGWFVIFYDPNQNIFREKLALPPSLADAPEHRLTTNCRNTKNIFRRIQSCLNCGDMTIFPRSPEGECVEEFRPDSAEDGRRILETLLHNLRTRGVRGDEITLLGARGDFRKTVIGENENIDEFRVRSPKSRKFVPSLVEYFTILRFKGCETGTLILLDVDPDSPDWEPRRLYTAVSRAVNRLFIIYAPKKSAEENL